MAMLKLLVTAVLISSLCACDAYKILVVFPVPNKSHGILGDGIVRHLLNAGNEVTYLLSIPKNIPHQNLTQVVVPENSQFYHENSINIKAMMDSKMSMDHEVVYQMMSSISCSTIKNENVQNLLRDPKKKFDAIIAEWMFSEMYSTLAAVFECPFIWFSSLEPDWQIFRLIDEIASPAYSVDIFTEATPPFDLLERANQLWIQINELFRKRRYFKIENQVYQTNVVPILKARGKSIPAYEDLIYNSSLMFGNSHVSLGLAPRLPQSYKPIGGFHIETKPAPLPNDLQKLFDNATNGVIYFSMGSNLKSKDIPETLKAKILNIFKGLKQAILWKFEEVMPDLPENVHIVPWAPQQSILAHPNCVLFITHGGLLSTTEAVHFGKPIIGIPVFVDQFVNVRRTVEKGFGRRVDLSYTMDGALKAEIDEILSNPRYTQKAKEWSFIYHHRPNPGHEVVHWTEHVIKTSGALHLRSPALLVTWYQKLYLDLIALVIVGVVAIILCIMKVWDVFNLNKCIVKKKTQ